jgi:trehalose 6-phosphate synthase
MTTPDEFISFAQKKLLGKKFTVAIQAEPYVHTSTPRGIKMEKAPGGAHVLLDGILKQVSGVMVAIGRGNADSKVVDSKGRFKVVSNKKSYTLKRLFLKKKELEGFYYGFANQTLWPLCHAVFVKPIFSPEWWQEYVNVNQKYADAIVEELGNEEGFIWINDYHLALLPKMLRERKPNLSVGTFWHIPWPTHEIFRICPWRKELLEGLLGSNFIGFHRDYHVQNFIECCRRELEVIVDTEPRSIIYKNQTTKVSNVPAGIDYDEIRELLQKQKKMDKRLIKKRLRI